VSTEVCTQIGGCSNTQLQTIGQNLAENLGEPAYAIVGQNVYALNVPVSQFETDVGLLGALNAICSIADPVVSFVAYDVSCPIS